MDEEVIANTEQKPNRACSPVADVRKHSIEKMIDQGPKE